VAHEHARATPSLERERRIVAAFEETPDLRGFAAAFLQPPLVSADYGAGLGTLYTAVYGPVRGSGEYRRPWEHSFDRLREGSRTIRLLETTAA